MSNPASCKVFFWNLLNMLFNLYKWFKMTVTIQVIQSHRRNSWGLERRLDGWRHLLFLQKTWMWSPAHTWWLQTSVPLVSEGPMLSSPQPQSSFDLHSYYTHTTHIHTLKYTHIHIRKANLKNRFPFSVLFLPSNENVLRGKHIFFLPQTKQCNQTSIICSPYTHSRRRGDLFSVKEDIVVHITDRKLWLLCEL